MKIVHLVGTRNQVLCLPCSTLDRPAQHRQQALASTSLAVMHLKTLQMQSDDPDNGILRIKLTCVQVNDDINLNGSVVVLSHNRLVCKTSKCTYSKTDVRDRWSSRVGNSPDFTTVHGWRVKRFGCKCWLYALH